MERYTISIDDYSKALSEASDPSYLAHLVNDFAIQADGSVVARWTVDKTIDSTYVICDRFTLFSSL